MRRLTRWFLALWIVSSMAVLAQTRSSSREAAAPDRESQEIDLLPAPPMSVEQDPKWLPPGADPDNTLGWSFVKHLASDQKAFWTSVKDLTHGGAGTFAPFAGFTGLLIASDSWLAKQVPDKPNQLKRSNNISQFATFSLVGAAGGSFLWGHLMRNDHMREAGLLSGEAMMNSTAVTFALRGIAQRERPLEADGSGRFFRGGNSFPSEHATIAWSAASVFAHEYPGPLTKFFAYGLASAVTLTRVTSKQHFASDALVGSAIGWYLGRQVYRAHHDPELGGEPWGDLRERAAEGPRRPENMGSPYVPIDSWVYPAFDRLAALGYVQSAYAGLRPWTRMECARLLEEAGERLPPDNEAGKLYDALNLEFSEETRRLEGAANLGVSIDSIYGRATGISGPPLRDGYHFGQTIINDYGRPYGEGFNSVAGVTAHAVAGPFAFYIRGEYQHAPAFPSYPSPVLQAIGETDLTRPLSNAMAEVNRFDVLDSLVAINLHNIQISFGKQSVWLGPGEAGPLLLSSNAEPILMLKIDHVSPYRLPLLSRLFGPVRTEFFIGQLAGHHFELNYPALLGPNIDPQPYLHGSKISFKPTPNLEFGMGVTAQFAGPGLPFTWHNFLRTFYSHTAATNDPAKRLSSFDFSYRVPGLRNWLTVYNDSLVVDEYSPIGSTRATLNPGIYMPRLPKIHSMELRAEGLREPLTHEFAPGFVYFGARRFRSGYTNDGQLLGSWIGRAGRGGQAWLTYSFSPRNKLQIGYRHQEVSKDFIGGGRAVDYFVRSDLMLPHNLVFSGFLQYEQWRFPVLAANRQSNATASLQLTYHPQWRLGK